MPKIKFSEKRFDLLSCFLPCFLSGGNSTRLTSKCWRQNMPTYVVSTSTALQFDQRRTKVQLDVSSDALPCVSTRPRLSQRHDRAEGVGWEAQAAAAGVCPQRKHPGHETCHQGAGNARVHSMYLILLFLRAIGAHCASTSRLIFLASRVEGFSQLSLHVQDQTRY